jgi:hypothetical protein
MENLNYFIATLNVERIMEDGTSKKVREDYLIDAMSFTEAEEKAVGEMEGRDGEFEVTRIVRPRLAGVMTSDSDRFFRVKITETTFDDNTMCEKKTAKAYIVQSSDLVKAVQAVISSMGLVASDWEFNSVTETAIVDYIRHDDK